MLAAAQSVLNTYKRAFGRARTIVPLMKNDMNIRNAVVAGINKSTYHGNPMNMNFTRFGKQFIVAGRVGGVLGMGAAYAHSKQREEKLYGVSAMTRSVGYSTAGSMLGMGLVGGYALGRSDRWGGFIDAVARRTSANSAVSAAGNIAKASNKLAARFL